MGMSSNLGFPRMGVHRELKKALEAHWAGKLDESGLRAVGQVLKLNHWVLQQQLGIQHIPSNDFSFYDHVLDTAAMVGAVPERYGWSGPQVDLATYFAMARGTARKSGLADVGVRNAPGQRVWRFCRLQCPVRGRRDWFRRQFYAWDVRQQHSWNQPANLSAVR